ncbi:unnamed protein product [Musa textilis]
MEGNSWRPAQGESAAASDSGSADWRTQLQPEARHRIVNKIMESLKRHLTISVPEGLNELQKIAIQFEEKIYTAASNQSDYLRRISLKLLSMENNSQHSASINPAMSNSTVLNQNSAHQGSSTKILVFIIITMPRHDGSMSNSPFCITHMISCSISYCDTAAEISIWNLNFYLEFFGRDSDIAPHQNLLSKYKCWTCWSGVVFFSDASSLPPKLSFPSLSLSLSLSLSALRTLLARPRQPTFSLLPDRFPRGFPSPLISPVLRSQFEAILPMEGNSWRPAQGESAAASDSGSADWRTQLQPEARHRIVNKIMETLKRHLPISVPEGLNELQKIAIRFEEKIYTAASNQVN